MLAADAFNTKMREFQQRYDALDHGVQVTRQALQQAYNDAMTKVENTALQIIADIAAERKANLVVTKAAVLFEAPGLDITQEVIHRLDAKAAERDPGGAGGAQSRRARARAGDARRRDPGRAGPADPGAELSHGGSPLLHACRAFQRRRDRATHRRRDRRRGRGASVCCAMWRRSSAATPG